MSCPSRARLAAAGAGEDITAELHAESCPRCCAELEAMATVVRVARAAPTPALSAERRARIAALAMAMAGAEPSAPHRRAPRRRWIGALAVAAIAAAVAIAAFPRREQPAPPATGGIAAAPSAVAPPGRARAADEPRAAAPPATEPRLTDAAPGSAAAAPHRSIAAAAPSSRPHAATARPPVAPPRDGTATFDARITAPVQVVAGDTSLRIAGSKAEVTAHGGTVTMVRVFAGSVEVVHAGTRQIVETGEIWVRPDAPPAEAEAASLHAFEQGWIALRELRDRDAVAAFDRAVDPVVAEDAAYWAAVASERSGDRSAAARRLHAFLARFPASVRAGDARRALARLEP